MTTLRDSLLPVADILRQIPNTLGLRRYSVTLRRRAWSGTYPGEGVPTDTDVVLTPPPRVRVMTTQDIASSGGTYREGDFKISAVTPSYVGGGYGPAQLNLRPGVGVLNQEITVILTGDEGTVECQLVEFKFDRPFTYFLVAREKRTAVGTTLG